MTWTPSNTWITSSVVGKSKQVKVSIINTPGCPAFPNSEWLNLVQGKSINLNNIFSGLYSISTNNQWTESIGEVEFKFGIKDASKPVSTHGDWTLAFNITHDAYLFTLTYRVKELKLYQQYILQHFATKQDSEHLHVIALDKAIRKWVSEWHDLLLSDFDQFHDLQTMHLDHYGAIKAGQVSMANVSGPPAKPPTRKCNEACWNWNKGVCR